MTGSILPAEKRGRGCWTWMIITGSPSFIFHQSWIWLRLGVPETHQPNDQCPALSFSLPVEMSSSVHCCQLFHSSHCFVQVTCENGRSQAILGSRKPHFITGPKNYLTVSQIRPINLEHIYYSEERGSIAPPPRSRMEQSRGTAPASCYTECVCVSMLIVFLCDAFQHQHGSKMPCGRPLERGSMCLQTLWSHSTV